MLFGGDVHRGLAGIAAVARAGVGVHDLPGPGRIVARRCIGRAILALSIALLSLGVVVSILGVRVVTVPVLTVAVSGGIGRVAGIVGIAVGRGFATRRWRTFMPG